MLLENKIAVVYGAGGSLGGAVARAFAQEGAMVWLTGHKAEPLQPVYEAILRSGGKAATAVVDALDNRAVEQHLDQLERAPDISFNLIGLEDRQDMPLTEMGLEDFIRPVNRAMRSQFITATAAARRMKQQQSGVILSLTATPGGIGYPLVGGFGPACCAIESFSKNLAAEVGPYGVRVMNIRSGGSPDSNVFREFSSMYPEQSEEVLGKMRNDTMLKTLPEMQDIAHAAVFICSPLAPTLTGTTIDLTVGTTSALNHRTAVRDPTDDNAQSFFNPKYQSQ
ncbi:SDR family NAD(P)-dependent oxidoreductase [Niabella beijingensis]|uniref:SDR family NAD(P)-dependent oxidoreductase n=1 Tax=Niabella beijingensis TaxID=2872700 RepID=UPI001CBD556B|nr:SDR family oxidoreductase [Niabella beijingensis]MBZ4191737.1 SDR family oxidoreductase [Niabella beijingensis]